MDNNCPLCHEHDASQKLTAIVSGGTVRGSFSGPTGGLTYSNGNVGSMGGYSRLAGTSSTDLVRKLAPPVKPSVKVNIGLKWITWSLWGFFALYLLADSCAASGYQSQSDQNTALWILGVSLTLAILGTVAISKETKAGNEKLPKEIEQWEKKMKIYDCLYYCYRDDRVFNSSVQGNGVPPERMQELLEVR